MPVKERTDEFQTAKGVQSTHFLVKIHNKDGRIHFCKKIVFIFNFDGILTAIFE
jgi:hypothetical protein